MKELKVAGIGATKKQAEPISISQEQKLWEQGLLRDSTPHVLIDMLVYMCGMYFALHSGREHQQLCPAMLSLVEPQNDRAYIEYTEFGSKNNPGGLKEMRRENKIVRAYANVEDPSRCFIKFYEFYMSL